MTAGEEIVALHEKISKCRGWYYNEQLRKIQTPHKILFRNADSLIEIARRLDDRAASDHLWTTANRGKLDDEFYEATRLLHNFAAAAKSVVDHTRNIVSDSLPPPLVKKYQDEVNTRFVTDPLFQFVQKLRNYALHTTSPIVGGIWDLFSGKRDLIIVKAPLLDWDGWNAPSRRFLVENEKILIGEFPQEYCNRADDFLKWIFDLYHQGFEKEFTEFKTLQDRLRVLYIEQGVPVD